MWSLVNALSDEDGEVRVATLTESGPRTIPPLAGYGEVDDVLRDWEAVAPLLARWAPADGAPLGPARLLAPVRSPRKLLCAGANYRGHAREMGITELPADLEPYFFMLPPTSITGPGADIVIPGDTAARVDWEAELAVVIGTGGRDIAVTDALAHIAGYTIMNDVSARGMHARPAPLAPPFVYDWLASKGRDTFSPTGPGITPAWFVPDPQDLPIRLWRNGKLEQDGNTADMIFTVAELIAAASGLMTLEPGDVIATGTPSGVGVAQGVSLADGDVVRVEIGPLGVLENPVRAVSTVPLGG
ncbi:fumarylacetoacetate hydrolase family protein [Amycolatopsis sp. GM8]|uniref:fumarylacetoacetate hydrolase family protein n=1 Tax=Amycolatopsis sp. GM8 TaxID=2896530 RepID=UPI001F3D8730|nr:fumarylacetoacetate hydrolase family protein [Amycolatopsis sp. GM8]